MRSILVYAEAMVLSLLIMFLALGLQKADLRVPFHYAVGGDVYQNLAIYKGIAENGWFLENPLLGAPGIARTYDYPYAETGTWLGVKLLILLVRDPFLAGNLFFLATFPTATLTSLYVLRRFGVDDQVAVGASLLFAFTPYHFWQGTGHPHFSAYYPIPLVVMVCLWLCKGDRVFFRRGDGGKVRPASVKGQTLPALVACGLVSLGGPYHVFFSVFLLLTATMMGLLRKPGWHRVLEGLTAVVLVLGLFAAQLVPFVVGVLRQGYNPSGWNRPAQFYYIYSLWFSNLFRPAYGHRLSALSRLATLESPSPSADLQTLMLETKESVLVAPLGVLASLGLLVLIGIALASPFSLTRRKPSLGDLGKLALAALLLGVAGGFGELVALYATSLIRCYARITIFLSFFAFLGLALLVGAPGDGEVAVPARRRSGGSAVVWIVTLLALVDQVPAAAVPDYARDARVFRSDRQFLRAIEQAVPAGSMIFQLPPNSYPEFGRHIKMYDYDHFRGYFHSNQLRWSYGAMRGRDAEKLHSALAPLPPAQLVDRLIDHGFAGIYVNRKGHAEDAREVIRGLRQKVPQQPIASADGELLFFRLPGPARAG
jgi:phosphoglycerol transferase